MILNENWQEISAGTIKIQKVSSGSVSICYAFTTPTTEDKYILTTTQPVTYELSSIPGLKIYGKSSNGDKEVIITQINTLGLSRTEEANLKGELYQLRSKFDGVAIGSSYDVAVSVGSKELFIAAREFVVTTDRLGVDVYVNPTYSGGTALIPTPYNGIITPVPTQVTIVKNPTISSVGVLFDEFLILGSPSNNQNNVAGKSDKDEVLRMIPVNTKFLFRFRNTGTVVMDGLIKYLYFEKFVN